MKKLLILLFLIPNLAFANDGISDRFDNDADNDGISNRFDNDADNDGISNMLDTDHDNVGW